MTTNSVPLKVSDFSFKLVASIGSLIIMLAASELRTSFFDSLSQVPSLPKIISASDQKEIRQIDAIISKYRKVTPEKRQELTEIILRISRQEGVDPSFIASVIAAESSYNEYALSSVGAVGLMQLLPSTARYVADRAGMKAPTKEDLHNPEVNIALGVRYLRDLLKKFKNAEEALLAYNWGPGNVVTRGAELAPKSSYEYARKIISGAGDA